MQPNSRLTFSRWLLLIASIGVAIFIVHGISLRGGLFMDDYAHIRQLREADWSLDGLAAACRLALVGENDIAEVWFMPECTLRFFRPISFGIMKLTYQLSGWNPTVLHAASLLWHWLASVLVVCLLLRVGARPLHAWLIALLFSIHPGHVNTVQWIACQTELMVTVFILLATLCFARFRGWPLNEHNDQPPRVGGWLFAGLAAFFYALALGCRENAIMFPLVMAAFEPVVGKRGRKSAIIFYAVLIAMAALYLVVRTQILGGASLPPRPYIFPPTDPGFVRFIFDKMLYYLLGIFMLFPCIPIGGVPYLRTMPFTFYFTAALVIAVLLWNLIRWRTRSPGWLGVAWVVLFLGPLLPAFASSHHLYLPTAGSTLISWLVIREFIRAGEKKKEGDTTRSLRADLVHIGLALGGVVFAIMSLSLPGLAIDTAQRVEDTIAAEVIASPTGLSDGDTLYVANMPLVTHYLKLIVEERTGLKDLRVVPLTWSPRVLGLYGAEAQTELSWNNERSFDISISHDPYFSGVLGMLVDEALGTDSPLEPGKPKTFNDGEFTVEMIEGDEKGITRLRFTFDKPPIRPGSHLYWGSSRRWAYEVPAPIVE